MGFKDNAHLFPNLPKIRKKHCHVSNDSIHYIQIYRILPPHKRTIVIHVQNYHFPNTCLCHCLQVWDIAALEENASHAAYQLLSGSIISEIKLKVEFLRQLEFQFHDIFKLWIGIAENCFNALTSWVTCLLLTSKQECFLVFLTKALKRNFQ